MGITQYIGSRYVPVFADPAEWNSTRTYEPLTIVLHEGNSYTSKQYVPVGVDITNENYWMLSANYNSQVAQYRREVLTFDDRITANTTAVSALESKISEAQDDIEVLNGNILCTFGDSWIGGYPIPQDLAEILNVPLKNYGVGGASWSGYGDVTMTFTEEVDVAAADSTLDKSKVKYVVVFGGVNDYRNWVNTAKAQSTPAQVIAGISSFTTKAKQTFPNAKIFVVPMQAGYNAQEIYNDFESYVSQIFNALLGANLTGFCPTARYWLMRYGAGIWQEQSGERLHPNADGCKVVASYLASVITGGYDGVHFSLQHDTSTTEVANLCTSFDTGIFTLNAVTAKFSGIDPSITLSEPISNYIFGTDRINNYFDCRDFTNNKNYTCYISGSTLKILSDGDDLNEHNIALNVAIHS